MTSPLFQQDAGILAVENAGYDVLALRNSVPFANESQAPLIYEGFTSKRFPACFWELTK